MKTKFLSIFLLISFSLLLYGCGSGYSEEEFQDAIDEACNTAYNDGYQAAKDDMERKEKEARQEEVTYDDYEMFDLIFYAYFEGYTDAQEGYETEYMEVTIDDLDLSDYYAEYGVFLEDDADELSALYYTEGYKDATAGRYPEFSSDVEECCGSPSKSNLTSKATQPEPESEQEPDPQSSATTSADTQTITVYVTNTGTKYHMNGCQYLSHSQIPISLSSAKASGYTACSRCHPPQ